MPSSWLQWGRDLSVAETSSSTSLSTSTTGFNGAATFQSRKPKRNTICCVILYLLQWGRDLSVAETVILVNTSGGKDSASMGPRPFSRGNLSEIGLPRRRTKGFNGAATFQSRKQSSSAIASREGAMLQWGRDLSVAETRSGPGLLATRARGFNGAATFQSRKRKLGASAGASEGRGFNGAATFQSRKPAVQRGPRLYVDQLQWGRDLSVAETAVRADDEDLVKLASMGPRPFSRGNPPRHSPI